MTPQFVKPLLKSKKNDHLDADGIGAAVQQPKTRFVTAVYGEQLGLQALQWVGQLD